MKLNNVIAFTGKRKKLKKLAKKLSLRKSREADHKIERKRFGSGIPTPSSYQRLVDGMEMESMIPVILLVSKNQAPFDFSKSDDII